MAKKGSLSIISEDISPVIKKWLYSDHDIFYREPTSNGSDAIARLKKLGLMGEYGGPEDLGYKIQVFVSPNGKTIRITDNGLSMTEDEVDKYINQIVFFGVQDFMEKYEDKANEDQIIGHFDLGFCSTPMVADKASINSLSCQKDSKPVYWELEGGTDSEMEGGGRAEVDTIITLCLNEDSTEFCNEYEAKEVIERYCAFMPMSIFLDNETAEPQYETIEKDELTGKDTVVETVIGPAKTEEKEKGGDTKEVVGIEPSREKYKINKRPVVLNDTNPLQNRHPNEYNEEDYKSFYHKVFRGHREPLFWIHPNMGYPFGLKDILYFPKINMEYNSLGGAIKLYNSQVFIADNIKEVIPKLLVLLKGVVDCPDLPFNVSRGALQNNGFVKKTSGYITKKVADKSSGMCKTDRDNYKEHWDDITPFIESDYIKDEKLAEKTGDFILYKNLKGKYPALQDYLDENKERYENTIFYVTNEKERSQYINMFKEKGVDIVIMLATVDSLFISHVEQKKEGLKFLCIDTDFSAAFKEDVKEDDEESKKTSEELTKCFKKTLNNDKLDIKIEKMKNAGVASMIIVPEDVRRIQNMMKMYSMGDMGMGMFGGTGETLVLNANHPLVQYVLGHKDDVNTSKICKQLYSLANLNRGSLAPGHMTAFANRSDEIMMIMAGEKAEPEKAE